jgi:hypothetical protein
MSVPKTTELCKDALSRNWSGYACALTADDFYSQGTIALLRVPPGLAQLPGELAPANSPYHLSTLGLF